MAASTRAIADAVGHGVPKIAKPLAMLEAEDSVETTRDGRGVYYRFKNPRPTYVLPTNTQPATTRDALAISSDRKSDRPATPAAYPPVGGVAGVASRSIAAEQLPDPY